MPDLITTLDQAIENLFNTGLVLPYLKKHPEEIHLFGLRVAKEYDPIDQSSPVLVLTRLISWLIRASTFDPDNAKFAVWTTEEGAFVREVNGVNIFLTNPGLKGFTVGDEVPLECKIQAANALARMEEAASVGLK